MARQFITGDKELEANLRKLGDRIADKVAKSAIRGMMTATASGIRKEAPVGKTRGLRKSIGSRLEKGRRGRSPTAKVGVGVGKQRKTAAKLNKRATAPHRHLVALGTVARTRKRIGGRFSYLRNPTAEQLSTGIMPANPFVKRGVAASRSKAAASSRRRAQKTLAKEVAKLNR